MCVNSTSGRLLGGAHFLMELPRWREPLRMLATFECRLSKSALKVTLCEHLRIKEVSSRLHFVSICALPPSLNGAYPASLQF